MRKTTLATPILLLVIVALSIIIVTNSKKNKNERYPSTKNEVSDKIDINKLTNERLHQISPGFTGNLG